MSRSSSRSWALLSASGQHGYYSSDQPGGLGGVQRRHPCRLPKRALSAHRDRDGRARFAQTLRGGEIGTLRPGELDQLSHGPLRHALRHLQPADARHRNVHQHYIRVKANRLLDSFFAVSGLTDEILKRWESMVAREKRFDAVVTGQDAQPSGQSQRDRGDQDRQGREPMLRAEGLQRGAVDRRGDR